MCMTHGHLLNVNLLSSILQDNGRSVPDLTASPGRAPHPGPQPMQSNQQHGNMQRQGGVKEPVLLQGDFRKVSGISSEIFRQIEAVENDHDPSTAAALDVIIDIYLLSLLNELLMQNVFLFALRPSNDAAR